MLQNDDFGSRMMIFEIEDHQNDQNFEPNPMVIVVWPGDAIFKLKHLCVYLYIYIYIYVYIYID